MSGTESQASGIRGDRNLNLILLIPSWKWNRKRKLTGTLLSFHYFFHHKSNNFPVPSRFRFLQFFFENYIFRHFIFGIPSSKLSQAAVMSVASAIESGYEASGAELQEISTFLKLEIERAAFASDHLNLWVLMSLNPKGPGSLGTRSFFSTLRSVILKCDFWNLKWSFWNLKCDFW